MSNTQHYYKVLLVSQPGGGKTTSARTLNRATTGFINVENKPLPFKGDFKYHIVPKDYQEVEKAIIEMAKNPEIISIYIDSLSAVFDMVRLDSTKRFKGFDIFNNINDTTQRLVDLIKRVPKEMFISAHYEIVNIEGAPEKRVKVHGKMYEGVIEKDFTMVLYGNKRFDEKGKPDYYFSLVEDGASAKCPPDMFGEGIYRIPNDCQLIYDKIQEFKQ